ncbi:hypothetical protein GCM10027403_28840 [Arthrobacter tecti]
MSPRAPRRPNNGRPPASSSASDTISAQKSIPEAAAEHRGQAPQEAITARKDAPVALIDRGGDSGTVVAFPEPPARRRRRWWLIGISAVILAIAGLLAYLVLSPALAVRNLDIQGNRLVPTEQVSAALAPLVGRSLTQISDDDVRALLADFPPVQDVSVAASPPSTLNVTIVERVPVAILESGGKFLLIDSEGRELATVAERESVALPLIDGGENAVNSDVFSSITAVLASLPADILERLVHASANSIDSVELKLTDGKTIFWGSAEENAAKSRVLAALLTLGEQDPPVSVYDVSTPSRPVTR